MSPARGHGCGEDAVGETLADYPSAPGGGDGGPEGPGGPGGAGGERGRGRPGGGRGARGGVWPALPPRSRSETLTTSHS